MALTATLIKTPHEVAFTGNTMPFVFSLTPYGYNEKQQSIILTIGILIEDFFGTNNFNEVLTQSFYPDNDGKIGFDIKSIIHPYLEFYTPRPTLQKLIEAVGQRKRYKISYLLSVNGLTIGSTTYSSTFFAIKGGVAEEVMHQPTFFTEYITANKNPLSYKCLNEKVGVDELRFMYWLLTANTSDAMTVTYKLYYDDNTNSTYTPTPTLIVAQYAVCLVPTGFNQCNLAANLSGGKTIDNVIKYEVLIYRPSNVLVAKSSYIIDNRNFYNTSQLIFRNSLGALDTVRLRGQIDFKADYDRSIAIKTKALESFKNLNLIAQNSIEFVEETQSYKGDTGFMSKADIEKLRDIFLFTELYEYQENKLLPATINGKTVAFYTNKDNLYSIQIEWAKAFTNKHFTPLNLLALPTSCPNVDTLFAVQKTSTSLQISYSLPLPYDMVAIYLVYNNATPTQTDDYFISGNNGVVIIPIDATKITTNPTQIQVFARVVCDINSNPISTGATTQFNINVIQQILPVANDDVYNIAAGFNSTIQLIGSVLANDYDPDGDPIEVVAVTSQATNAGGVISITSVGIVSYQPPANFQGQDYYDYFIRNVGGSTNIPVRVYINVGEAITMVFVKMETIYTPTYGGGNSRVELKYFSNPQGTSAIDLSSRNITIYYDIIYTGWVAIHYYGSTPHTEHVSFVASGKSNLIYNSWYISYNQNDIQYGVQSKIEHILVANAAYTII